LGFANFYKQFIKGYLKIAESLINLTKKEVSFNWTEEANKAFLEIKKRFTKEPILYLFRNDRESFVETNASNTNLGAAYL